MNTQSAAKALVDAPSASSAKACPGALLVMEAGARDDVYPPVLRTALAERCRWLAEPVTKAELLARPELLREADVLFTSWGAPVLDDALLAAAPRLRAVFHAAGSVRKLVTPEFWARDITLCTAAAVNAVPVAEFAFGAILLSLKRVWTHATVARRDGAFAPPGRLAGACGSTVGLVSLGAIARRLVHWLRQTEVRIIAWDPYVSPEDFAALGVERAGLEALFEESDVVSLHTPLLPATRGFVGADLLGRMRHGATLLNTARGGLIREAELIDVLTRRPDLTALLDVTEPEPPLPGSALYKLPNVVLTPHIAGSIGAERGRLGALMGEEFVRWIGGEPLRHRLTRDRAECVA